MNLRPSFPADLSGPAEREEAPGEPQAVFRLAYVSEVSALFGPDDLREIEERSLVRNEELDITGILVIDAGKILQILEGSQTKVEDLFARIARDPRHQNVRLVAGSEVAGRLLHSWSLVSGEGRKIPDGIIAGFHALYHELASRTDLTQLGAREIDLLKEISLLRSVPL